MLLVFVGLAVVAPLWLAGVADKVAEERLAPKVAEQVGARQQSEDAALAAKLDRLGGLPQRLEDLRDELDAKNKALAEALKQQQRDEAAKLQGAVDAIPKKTDELPAKWDESLAKHDQKVADEVEKRLGNPRLESALADLEKGVKKRFEGRDQKDALEMIDAVRKQYLPKDRSREP
jgi:hypothetical protein